jgi:putative ABC transport system permease protein
MLAFASYTVLDSAGLRTGNFLVPLALLFSLSNLPVLLYFNAFVVRLDNFFEARYLIPVAGMLVGNSLRANIVGLDDLYRSVSKNEHRYLYRLGLGATRREALLPYIRSSMLSALRPTLANMATMGIVFLPGMMTGQILGGASPVLAIKYQITIMLAIFVTTIMGALICILVFVYRGFDEFHILKSDLLKNGH